MYGEGEEKAMPDMFIIVVYAPYLMYLIAICAYAWYWSPDRVMNKRKKALRKQHNPWDADCDECGHTKQEEEKRKHI